MKDMTKLECILVTDETKVVFAFRLVISREQRAHIMSWLSLLEYPWYNQALRFAL